jgi:hypothetical protein
MVKKYFNIDRIVLGNTARCKSRKQQRAILHFKIEPATAMPEEDSSDLYNYSSNI